MGQRRKSVMMVIFVLIMVLIGAYFIPLPSEKGMSKKELVERKHDFSSGPATQRVSFVEAVCTAALRCNNMRTEVNGVILFLAGKKEPLFYEKTLPLLDMNFLAYYPYPVHVFHEDMSLGTQEEIRDVLPSARSVTFEDVSQFWRTLPHGVSEEQLNEWMNTPEQLRYHKRGYRIMCRFWAGLVWQLPSLDSYEYYWRLDTDSFLTKTVPCDVFRLMHRRQCSYGYRLITLDSVNVVKDLWPTFEKWAVTALSTNELESVTRFALRDNTTEYTRMMYYNNFELGTIALKRHPLYTSMFRFLDENEPLGILRYRWGDAPIHTLGVEAVMLREGWRKCHFDRNFAGYKHGK